jgi:hypothetical protein
MTSLIFLLTGLAMVLAVRGQRALAIGLFALAFVASALWLFDHMVSPMTIVL